MAIYSALYVYTVLYAFEIEDLCTAGIISLQLGDREGINNTDDLQSRLMVIRDSITLTQLHILS